MERTRVEQLIDKVSKSGFAFLTAEEAAELFLCFAASSSSPEPLATKLRQDGDVFSFFDLSGDELKRRGAGDATAFLIEKFPEVASRCLECVDPKNKNFRTVQGGFAANQQKQLERLILNKFMGAYEEKVLLILFGKNKRILCADFLGGGNNNSVSLDISKICSRSLYRSARYAVLAHNHPGGSCYPSADDCEATSSLFKSLRAIGIVLLDHYIVTRTKICSIRTVYDFSTNDESELQLMRARLKYANDSDMAKAEEE